MSRRSGRLRRALVGLVVVLAGVIGWWVVGAPDADPAAVLAVEVAGDVVVERTDALVSLHPASGPGDEALVLYPGARVPPEAYLATLRPFVVATGISVHVPALPLRLAVLAPARADVVRARFPAVRTWWIGGHSLGGAMAAAHAAGAPVGVWRGVLLLAAYPPGEGLGGREDLAVLSLVGGRDGLTTLDDVERRRALLPTGATVRVLEGVNHAQFGRYGRQAGDLEPTVGEAEATRLIAEALSTFVLDVDATADATPDATPDATGG